MSNRILATCCVVLFACTLASTQLEESQSKLILVNHPLKWHSPPRALHSKEKWAYADFVVFYPNNQFAGVSCQIIKHGTGIISISVGDGDVVRVGRWQKDTQGFSAKSRVVFRTLPIFGRAIPEPEEIERFGRLARNQLRGAKSEYAPLPEFSDLAYLDNLIRCDRREWDGHEDRKEFVPPCAPTQ